MMMSRYPLQAVTSSLAILVDADTLEEADGWGTCFPAPSRTKFMAVRVVKNTDIEGRLQKIFPREELPLVVGAAELKRAYHKKDEFAFRQAFEKVRPWVPSFGGLGRWSLESLGPSSGDKWAAGVRWIYSSLMSNVLQNARLIMWCSDRERRFWPALYCPNWRIAAFVLEFIGRIRVCPKCTTIFIPSTDNQEYCKPAHGVSYRTAQSRWRAKQHAEDQKRRTRKSLR